MFEKHPKKPEISQRRLYKFGALASSLALMAGITPAATSEAAPLKQNSSPDIEHIGISTNDIFTDNAEQADAAAQMIENLGATAVRFFYPLNKNTAWENYKDETCNAFRAAYNHHLQPIVTFRGYDENGPGYVPYSSKEIYQLSTTAASIIWTVASNKDNKNPGGCVPEQKTFIFEGINEINNDMPFNRNLGENTPSQALKIDSRLSRALKNTASRPEVRASVTYGEALAVGNHDVVGFLRAQVKAMKQLGIDNPYDFIDVHPYPKNPTDDPSVTMANLSGPITDIINTSFAGTQLAWGEVGVNTINPPADKAKGYSPPVSNVIGVSEAKQAKYLTNAIKTAADQGVSWITLFDAKDDGSGSMPSSGEYYVDGTPKSSLVPIKNQINKSTSK